jgi:LacI family transcriptional regulator/LacI family repressor for deo operon, udp, cdd, tsx, nupC, and nupG
MQLKVGNVKDFFAPISELAAGNIVRNNFLFGLDKMNFCFYIEPLQLLNRSNRFAHFLHSVISYQMKVTIHDIARAAGVSKSTVSAVLNDNPLISDATKRKVRRIMERFNYTPNEIARSLASRQTKTIGLIIKEIDNPYYGKMTKGIYNVAHGKKHGVILCNTELEPQKEVESVTILKSKKVDGLIISPLQERVDVSHIAQLKKEKYPFVLIGGIQNLETNVVDIDNEKAAYEAVSYLIAAGHKRIAHLLGPVYSVHSRQRCTGYKKALRKHKLPLHDDLIIEAGRSLQDGYEAGMRLLKRSKKFTAVFCYNDLLAIGFMRAARECRLKIPEDIAVIGFDDIELASFTVPPLTTVSVPMYQLGEESAKLLFEQIEHKERHLAKRVILDAPLTVRETA